MPSIWRIKQFKHLENSSSDSERSTRREISGVNSKRRAICHHRPAKKPVSRISCQQKTLSSSAVQPPNQQQSSGRERQRGKESVTLWYQGSEHGEPPIEEVLPRQRNVSISATRKRTPGPRGVLHSWLSLSLSRERERERERERVEWPSRLKLARAYPLFSSTGTSNRYNAPSFTCT